MDLLKKYGSKGINTHTTYIANENIDEIISEVISETEAQTNEA